MSSISPATPAHAAGNDAPPEADGAGAADPFYALIRSQIEHEDNLSNTRLNWFITAQSFLFTAYAITAGNAERPAGQVIAHSRVDALLLLIPLVALCTSVVIASGIVAGVLAMRNLHRHYRQYAPAGPGRDLPPIQGYRNTLALGLATPLALPVIFMAVWLFLLAQRFLNAS